MWNNNVVKWPHANNSGTNFDLNKIGFLHLQYSYWTGFESEKLELLCSYLAEV